MDRKYASRVEQKKEGQGVMYVRRLRLSKMDVFSPYTTVRVL